MTAQAGMAGYAPTVVVRPINAEAERYRQAWQTEDYRRWSPGEMTAMAFLRQAQPPDGAEVIDFGCGTGRGALMLAALGRCRVKMLDFADNCLDPEVRAACETQGGHLSFEVCDLTRPIAQRAAYGYCCDVMEHIPPDDVPGTLRNILLAAQHCWFQISLQSDHFGKALGLGPLHLTVRPMEWWLERLREAGAVVHWSEGNGEECSIYCSAWKDASAVLQTGRINVPAEVVDAQVRANVLAGWQQVTPHDRQAREVILLAGGPSLTGQLERIRALRAEGCALATCNGAYAWALDHGLEPSVQIVLDAREFNARFVRPVTPYTKYLVASQCHPSTLEGLPRERTFLWHSGLSDANEALVRERNGGLYFPVPGGSTVVLRSIPLLRMLGLASVHLFGFDSCVEGERHHAYAQQENDGEPVVPVACGGRTFYCTPWHLSQAAEFRDLVAFLGNEVEMAVYGDGLVAHMIETGAQISRKGH